MKQRLEKTKRGKARPGPGKLRAVFWGWCLCFAACAGPGNRPVPGTLRFNIATEPPSLDWSIATDQSSIRVIMNIMEGLTRFDENLKPRPALAESWEVLDDGRRYIFRLRKDARWTNGRPVVADDFVYAWRRLVNPETGAEYAYFIYMVENAEAINKGKIKDLSKLGVRAISPHELEVRLSRPVVFFPMLTAFVCTYPLPREAVDRWGDDWTEPEHIVTCGPFKLKEWRHEYRLILERNPGYYGPPPPLRRVVFYMVEEESTALSLYLTGGLDAVYPLPPPAIPSLQKSPEYVSRPYFASYYYGFNTKKPPVDNPLVRAALAHAIDRSELPRILKGGQIPNKSLIPAGAPFANLEIGRGFDPELARKLLAKAGYPDGKGLPPITIAYNTQESHKLIAEFVQEQWKRHLGIEVRLRNMEWKVFLKELQYDPPQVFRLGWILDYPDPDAIMTVFLSDSGNNHTRWASEEYDRLVLSASLERDPKKRRELYDQAQRVLLERDTVIIPLYTYSLNMLIKPWVENFPVNGLDLLDLRKTRIKEQGR